MSECVSEAQRAVCVFACVRASSVWNELISARNANPSKNDRAKLLHSFVVFTSNCEHAAHVCYFWRADRVKNWSLWFFFLLRLQINGQHSTLLQRTKIKRHERLGGGECECESIIMHWTKNTKKKEEENFVENLKLRIYIYIRCVQGVLCFWFRAVIWLNLYAYWRKNWKILQRRSWSSEDESH